MRLAKQLIGTCVLFLAMLQSLICFAGGSPENILLVVNENSDDSMAVATHYAQLRDVPSANVLHLDYRGKKASISGETFRTSILGPILETIETRMLAQQIDYIIYSCDFPFTIDLRPDFPNRKFPIVFRPIASLTGATYLANLVRQKSQQTLSPNSNAYANDSDDDRDPILSSGFRRYRSLSSDSLDDSNRYFLSAMLGVTFGRGNTVDEIKSYLTRAATADCTRPTGKVYFLKNTTSRSTPRHDQFESASNTLKKHEIAAEIRTGLKLPAVADVIGLTSGHSQLMVANSGCEVLPGAFCDNLTSRGGKFQLPKKGPGQTCLSEFLRLGAAGACGTVTEPTNLPHKFPSPFMHVHYARGCSLAEAFYQSVLCPYQQLLVGDPLCQPWATKYEIEVTGKRIGQPNSATVQLFPRVRSLPENKRIKEYELFIDGVATDRCKHDGHFIVDPQAYADGTHELRIVAAEDSPIGTCSRWIKHVQFGPARNN